MSKKTFTLIIVIFLALIGGAYYWFFVRNTSPSINTGQGSTQSSGGFSTFNRPGESDQTTNATTGSTTAASNNTTANYTPIPALRQLTTTPIGGMVASTTGSTTIVRWIDRGVGHVFQAYSDNTAITELSNTTVPRVYETYWNKNATDFILQSLNQDSDLSVNFYAKLYPQNALSMTAGTSSKSTTSENTAGNTTYELRGTPVPSDIVAMAVSPQGNSLFTLEKNSSTNSDAGTIGYTAMFDGTKKTEVLSMPLTMVTVEWPENNTIAITTKASSYATGDLYFVNPKTGAMTTILSEIRGLDTLTSKDAESVIFTASTDTGNGMQTSLYNIKTGATQSMLFNTLPAEKCVWSSLQKTVLYCAVPFQIPSAVYPDAWYQGSVSFSDSIFEVDTATGETHLVSDLLKTSGMPIDATNLILDPHENYLYFINKKNLTLWSLELNG